MVAERGARSAGQTVPAPDFVSRGETVTMGSRIEPLSSWGCSGGPHTSWTMPASPMGRPLPRRCDLKGLGGVRQFRCRKPSKAALPFSGRSELATRVPLLDKPQTERFCLAIYKKFALCSAEAVKRAEIHGVSSVLTGHLDCRKTWTRILME